MTNRFHPIEFLLIAAIAFCAAMAVMSVRSAPGGGVYELARYTGAGDRYVDDHDLTFDDCMAAIEAPHASALRCEVER